MLVVAIIVFSVFGLITSIASYVEFSEFTKKLGQYRDSEGFKGLLGMIKQYSEEIKCSQVDVNLLSMMLSRTSKGRPVVSALSHLVDLSLGLVLCQDPVSRIEQIQVDMRSFLKSAYYRLKSHPKVFLPTAFHVLAAALLGYLIVVGPSAQVFVAGAAMSIMVFGSLLCHISETFRKIEAEKFIELVQEEVNTAWMFEVYFSFVRSGQQSASGAVIDAEWVEVDPGTGLARNRGTGIMPWPLK